MLDGCRYNINMRYEKKTRGVIRVTGKSHSKADTAFEMGYTKGFFGKDIESHWLTNQNFLLGYQTGKQDRRNEQ